MQRAMEAGRAAAQQAREDLERRIAETKAVYQTEAASARGAQTAGSRGAVATSSSSPPDSSGVDEEPETA